MRGAAEVEPRQDGHASCSILVRPFRELDLTSRDVEEERLALVILTERVSGNPPGTRLNRTIRVGDQLQPFVPVRLLFKALGP
jgi:hypothetical protein